MKINISDAWFEMEKLPSGQRVVYTIDVMPFIQKHIYYKPKYCTIVNFVGVTYHFEPSISLKQEGREKRGQSGSSARKEYELYDTHEVHDWDLISQNMRNSQSLGIYWQFMDEKQFSRI